VDAKLMIFKMKKMRTLTTMLLAVCLFTSCLKNDIKLDYRGIAPLVINPKFNYPTLGFFPTAVTDTVFGKTRLNLMAKYSYQTPAPKDIIVTFKRDDDLVTQYNTKFFTRYLPLPADSYQMSGLQVTIPAGSQIGTIPITIIPSKIAGVNKYMIAFTIVDAQGIEIADNQKNIVYGLKGQ
jgi:hypothetical protein